MEDPVEIQEVLSRSLLRTYIYLPAKIYQEYANFVPPIYLDEWKFHNRKHNRSLGICEVIRFVAFQHAKPVGRIMGIIHHLYNEQHGEKTARFFQFDCINQQGVADALFKAVGNWAKKNGMNKLIGPFGFSDKDPEGVQVEGFEHLPVISTPTNPPYLPGLIECAGFSKKLDCVSYQIPVPQSLPLFYEKIYARIIRNTSHRLLEFKNKKELKPYVLPVLKLVNETYTPLFGFVEMTEEEMRSFASQYMPILDPDFVKLVLNEKNEPVAFIVALPDMSKGLQRAKGHLFPFGFIHLLRAAKKTRQLDLLLGAVKPESRGIGLNVILGQAIIASAIKRGFINMDSHLVLETNRPMCGEYEHLGGKVYKRFRVFERSLAD